MNIKWRQFTWPDGTTHRQIAISEFADWKLFDVLATKLPNELGGQWVEKMDGLDQRYWDFECDSGKITLHLEHYLGISIYPTDGADASPFSLTLLDKAFDFLTQYEPSKN